MHRFHFGERLGNQETGDDQKDLNGQARKFRKFIQGQGIIKADLLRDGAVDGQVMQQNALGAKKFHGINEPKSRHVLFLQSPKPRRLGFLKLFLMVMDLTSCLAAIFTSREVQVNRHS